MAKSWRDFSADEPASDGCAISAISANSALSGPDEGPNGANGANGTALPADIQAGLAMLGRTAAPRLRCPDRWPVALADAVRLANEGWALAALNLGWSALDLFGAFPAATGDPDADGLAVRLAGRKVLAICASFATVADADGGRTFLYRGNNAGARLLWELGRAR